VIRHDKFVVVERLVNTVLDACWDLRGADDFD
jgi:hypothetical protein